MRVVLWRPWRYPPPLGGVAGGAPPSVGAGWCRAGRGRLRSHTSATSTTRQGSLKRLDYANSAAISTPMGMESEISEAASSRGFDIPEYVEVTRLVTIRTILKALSDNSRLIVPVTSACFSRWREK